MQFPADKMKQQKIFSILQYNNMSNLIKQMNLTDLKVYALGSLGLYINLGDFNSYIATATGVIILGYTISKWYYLVKSKGKDGKQCFIWVYMKKNRIRTFLNAVLHCSMMFLGAIINLRKTKIPKTLRLINEVATIIYVTWILSKLL